MPRNPIVIDNIGNKHKRCFKCNRLLPLSLFRIRNVPKQPIAPYCVACSDRLGRERWAKLNPRPKIVNIPYERWRPVPGYEGFYEASNMGRIKSLRRKHTFDRILAAKPLRTGYHGVALSKRGIHKYVSVHRVVAITFKKNPFNLPEVNHKDRNRSNNELKNLEWVTGLQNINHAIKNKALKIRPLKSFIVSRNGKNLGEFWSFKKASLRFNISAQSIKDCLTDKKDHIKKYKIEYI